MYSSTPADAPISYADWKAPDGDGQLLIWPEIDAIVDDARQNNRALRSSASLVQNVPLSEVRGQMRSFLGQPSDDVLLFATGHQTELYHPGVWAKDVLINAVAARANASDKGDAIHFAVDTDQPKHLSLRWPGESIPLTDDAAFSSAAWSGLLAPPTPGHLEKLERAAAMRWPTNIGKPLLFDLLRSLRRQSLEPTTLSAMLTSAQHEIDWSFGLRHHAMLISPMLQARAYLAFVCHLMSRPDKFAASYNAALAEYRSRTGTTNPMRPMPDLFTSDESIESPFWLDDLSAGTRTRPSLFRSADGWLLSLLDGETFTFDRKMNAFRAADELSKFLTASNHRLSPRALTLTTFLRLFVADQFVHGIGGGRYDQVTDRLIASFFDVSPPRFAVTTATMFLPESLDRDRVCLSCMRQQGHRLKHRVLGSRKQSLVAMIDAAPRRSPHRETLFAQMQRELRLELARSPRVAAWEAAYREAQVREKEEAVLFNRELPYVVQPRERLIGMIERYQIEPIVTPPARDSV